MEQVENPMIRAQPKEPKVVGECAGCMEDILEGEDIYEFDDLLVHQSMACCQDYVSNRSVCRVAGE